MRLHPAAAWSPSASSGPTPLPSRVSRSPKPRAARWFSPQPAVRRIRSGMRRWAAPGVGVPESLVGVGFCANGKQVVRIVGESRRPSSSQSRAPLCHASDRETTCSIWTASEVPGAADERDRLTGGRVDQDIALGVARVWPHDQLAEDARREAASAAIRPRQQPGHAARSRV